ERESLGPTASRVGSGMRADQSEAGGGAERRSGCDRRNRAGATRGKAIRAGSRDHAERIDGGETAMSRIAIETLSADAQRRIREQIGVPGPARGSRRDRSMNGWERAYASELAAQRHAGI